MDQERARFGVLSDLHLAEKGTQDSRWINPQPLGRSTDLLAEALTRVGTHDVDAILLLGDLTDLGTPAQVELLREALAPVSAPVWAVAGNHDFYGTLSDPVGVVQLSTPTSHPTSAGCTQLVAGTLAHDAAADTYSESAPPEPAGWAVQSPAVWLSHYPVLDVRPALDAAGLPHPGDLVNRADVHAGLREHRGPTLVLAGHIHVHVSVAHGDVLQLNHAPLVEQPHAYSVLEVSVAAGEVHVDWQAHPLTPHRADLVDTFLAGRRQRWHWAGAGWRTVPLT